MTTDSTFEYLISSFRLLLLLLFVPVFFLFFFNVAVLGFGFCVLANGGLKNCEKEEAERWVTPHGLRLHGSPCTVAASVKLH